VVLPKDIVKKNKAALMSGQWFVRISDGRKYLASDNPADGIQPAQGSITTVPASSAKSIRDTIHTRSLDQVDVRSVLVLRISTIDSEPSFSASELHGLLFNNSVPSLRSQYYWCSFAKLQLDSTEYGVMEVSLSSLKAAGSTSTDLMLAAYSAANNLLGVSKLENEFDHVMFCLPPGTIGNWAAAAPVHHWRSVYNDKWCGYITGYMHEMGHNLGLLVSVSSACKKTCRCWS
jgi:hypothetical protein